VTAQEYGRNLEANLNDLVDRLIRNAYRARLVKRVRIPKDNGKDRKLGIPTLEDRLLQKAVSLILEAIYESTFLDCSHGYRPGRSPKGAVKAIRDELNFGVYDYVVEADIKGFFDNLDREWLIKMLEMRIEDRKLIRLIRKWLNAGILETDKMVLNPLTGTPQGGIVSPILANVYLHYGLDMWMENSVKKSIKGRMKYVRFADDFVCAFSLKMDAERVYRKLPKRLGKFGLEVAQEKTRIITFGRFRSKANGRFDFLGFELFWGKCRNGMPHLKRRTSRKRQRRALKAVGEWIEKNRSRKMGDLIDVLNRKLQGHYNYYGVIGNTAGIGAFHHQVTRLLFKWLNRRSQKKSMTWPQFTRRIKEKLSKPRVTEKRVLQRKLFGLQR
jgi:group II intron reverse transcriptase/maturase